MIRALKTLFVLLLMVALPLQGLAAVMKASCGPAHHGSGSLPVAAAAADQHHHHEHGAIDGHHSHDVASAHSSADSPSPDFSLAADESPGTYKSSYCSACAACCIGAAAPPSSLNWSADHSGSETVLVPPTPLVTGYIPEGLKRPPRHISA